MGSLRFALPAGRGNLTALPGADCPPRDDPVPRHSVGRPPDRFSQAVRRRRAGSDVSPWRRRWRTSTSSRRRSTAAATERSIRDSVRNAIRVAQENRFQSIAFPLIGAGSGSFNQDKAKALMLDELDKLDVEIAVTIVVFKAAKK